MLSNIETYSEKINYKKLITLIKQLKSYRQGEKLYAAIQKIESDKTLIWAKTIKQKSPLLTIAKVPLIGVCVTIVIGIISLSPDTIKSNIFNLLTAAFFNVTNISYVVMYLLIIIILAFYGSIKSELIPKSEMKKIKS